jgi:hypothetical protein
VTGDGGAGATFLHGNAVHAPGRGYANGDELLINGEKVKVTSTILLTDDMAIPGAGYSVTEQLTLADQTGWEEPLVIEITSVDGAGRATGIEKRSGGVYNGEEPLAELIFERVEQAEARGSGSGSGSGTDGSATELSAVSQQAQAVQQQQEVVSPVLATAAACGFVVVVVPAVAALVSWRRRCTKSAAQQVAAIGSTPCAASSI